MIDILHDLLAIIIDYSIVIFEFIGVFILVSAGLKGAYEYITKNPLTKLNLAKGMAAGLEFKLGSEILRTVVVRDFEEIALVGSIIVLRAALAFLIHWEITNEEKVSNHLEDKKEDLISDINELHQEKIDLEKTNEEMVDKV